MRSELHPTGAPSPRRPQATPPISAADAPGAAHGIIGCVIDSEVTQRYQGAPSRCVAARGLGPRVRRRATRPPARSHSAMMAVASLADVGRSPFASWLIPLPSDVLYILSQSTNRAVSPGEDRSKSSNDLTEDARGSDARSAMILWSVSPSSMSSKEPSTTTGVVDPIGRGPSPTSITSRGSLSPPYPSADLRAGSSQVCGSNP